ncbi:MAG: hypothetical protein K9J16_08655 [Melioribacteraceae bacterium]|nr:hypothetical protein [Melioribacteraceae bacterium]MCF8353785.1 hypothetical protein [Melioribacteraceae bacterium]MCF8393621.1 hypothetical protein [Melioribacteraceae bacterium]
MVYTIIVLVSDPVGENPPGAFRVLFPFVTGVVPVWVWATVLINKYRSNAEYIYQRIPVRFSEIIAARFYLIVFPFIFITIYLFFVHFLIISDWYEISKRIAFMSGTQMFIVSVLYFSFELAVTMKTESMKIVASWFSAAAAILFLILVDFSAFAEEREMLLGFMYMLLSFLIIALGCAVYAKRKSFVL